MLTRVLTLFGVLMYQTYFGLSNVELNIFNYAISIPNYVFTALGTSLTIIVIPIYTSLKAKGDDKRGKKFIDDLITLTSFLIIIMIIVSIIFAPAIISTTEYKNDSYTFGYAVFALRILLPVMFFFSLRDILVGFLQANDKFKVAAAVSLPTSLMIIFYIKFFANTYEVKGLMIANLIGLCLQAFFLIPSVIKTGYRYKFSFDYKSEDIKNGLKLVPAVLLSTSAYQINMLYNTTMSTFFGAVSMINLVFNTMLIPVLTLVYSITAVYFPKMSYEWENDNEENYVNYLKEIFGVIIFLLIPATVGLIVLRFDVMNLLANWGRVTDSETTLTSNILGIYSLSIVFVGLKETLDKAFYAQKRTKPSGIVGIIIMLTNILVIQILKNKFGAYSIPVGYFISAFTGSLILFVLLGKTLKSLRKEMFVKMLKCLVSACIMGIVVYGISILLKAGVQGDGFFIRILVLAIPIFFGVIIYFISSAVFKIEESLTIFNKIKLGMRKGKK